MHCSRLWYPRPDSPDPAPIVTSSAHGEPGERLDAAQAGLLAGLEEKLAVLQKHLDQVKR